MRVPDSFLTFALGAIAAIAVTPNAVAGWYKKPSKPVNLVIEAPEAVKPGGELFTEGWPLTISMEVKNAVAFVTEDVSSFSGDIRRRQALVTTDPDGCLDMRNFDGGNPGSVEPGCTGQDETYFEFRFDPTNWARLRDSRCAASTETEPFILVDDAYNPSAVDSLNKPYVNNSDGGTTPRPVGPDTGGMRDMVQYPTLFDDPTFDCYGFGADVDGVPGLVVWADIGPFKVMDSDLNGTGAGGAIAKLRNGAGFITSVSSVLLDRTNRSNVKATIIVPRGLFEPIVAIDTDISPTGPYAGFDYLRQLDNGPIEGLNYVGGPVFNVGRARVIAGDLPRVRVKVKAVLVEGPAPDFITDVNLDGKFTRADLEAEGYTLLSNVARYNIRAVRSYNIESGGDRCPPSYMLIAKDLDGAESGNEYFCSTGNARSGRRVPR